MKERGNFKSKEGSSSYFNKQEEERNVRETTRTTKKKHGFTCLEGRIKAAQES